MSENTEKCRFCRSLDNSDESRIWCYRFGMETKLDYTKCPEFEYISEEDRTENEGTSRINHAYEGHIARGGDRRNEKTHYVILAGVIGAIGIIVGVILGSS